VTINYRLGPLGFLSLDADLAAEVLRRSGSPPLGTGGTNGMADQLAALNWTSTRIAGFGGDPARRTLAGESAGGQSVCSLAISPLARPFAPTRAVI
jgi:para-nitrobenzyl esterase